MDEGSWAIDFATKHAVLEEHMGFRLPLQSKENLRLTCSEVLSRKRSGAWQKSFLLACFSHLRNFLRLASLSTFSCRLWSQTAETPVGTAK
jgi:hypothetical protein